MMQRGIAFISRPSGRRMAELKMSFIQHGDMILYRSSRLDRVISWPNLMHRSGLRTFAASARISRSCETTGLKTLGVAAVSRCVLAQDLDEPVSADTNNLVRNGSFSSDKDFWNEEVWTQDSYKARLAVEIGVLHAMLDNVPAGDGIYKIQIKQIIEGLAPNTDYELKFRCRGSIPQIIVQIMNDSAEYQHLGLYQTINTISPKDSIYLLQFRSISKIPAKIRLSFSLASSTGEFYLDDVVLRKQGLSTIKGMSAIAHEMPPSLIKILPGNQIRIMPPSSSGRLQVVLYDIAGREIFRKSISGVSGIQTISLNHSLIMGVACIKTTAFRNNRKITETISPIFLRNDRNR